MVRLQGVLERHRGMRTLFTDAIRGAEGRRFADPRRAGRRFLLQAKHGRSGRRGQPSDDEAKVFYLRDPWHRCWCAYLRLTRPALYHGQAFWDNAVAVTLHRLDAVRAEVEDELVSSATAILGTVDTIATLRPLSEEKGRYTAAVSRIDMAVLDEAGTVPEFKIPLLAAVGVRYRREPIERTQVTEPGRSGP